MWSLVALSTMTSQAWHLLLLKIRAGAPAYVPR
jgi:hypothetical protein